MHVLDFGPPQSRSTWLISLVLRHLERTADIIAGRLPGMIRCAGFDIPAQTERHLTMIGTLALYLGRK
jgi:hypothetical protein